MRVVIRSITKLLLVGAAAILLGCGGGSNSSTASTASTSHSSPGRTRAVAYAHAVNLTLADLPGARIVAGEREARAPSAAAIRFARCAGAVDPRLRIADVDSAKFALGAPGRQIKSGVEVLPSAALAARNLAAVSSARGRACLARFLSQAARSAAPTQSGHVSISSLPDLLPGSQGYLGLRVTFPISTRNPVNGRPVQTQLTLDEFVFISGSAEITLSARTIKAPIPTATERRLLALLVSRAHQHTP
jgi:hypothetical protein